ncbi:hypothetical protein ACIQUQ_33490 [Streptomyces sp. NPDC101118]|uniref:hypothetical protein n=1 Tax=Streptomyces sp. NPDC101118 TaxID=3366109 RepID=UPI0038269185
MFAGRRGVVAGVAAVLAMGALGFAGGGTAAVAGAAAGAPSFGDCPAVREKVDRLEGRITPNACAFMQRQLAFGETPTGTPPALGELGHPRVRAYLDIFDADASLWEAGGAVQRGHTTIGTSITGSLRLAPDLRYRGTDVVADGAVMMFGQWNEVTLKGRTVAYPQIARNLLGDDGKTLQARRYYDRAALFRDTLPGAVPDLFGGVAGRADGASEASRRAPERFRADEIADRLAAWNGADARALVRRMAGARLSGPGLREPLTSHEAKTAYLERLFGTADLRFKAGQAAFGRTTAYVEWHGTARIPVPRDDQTAEPRFREVSFGIVERFGPGGAWELYFDTLPLVADQSRIGTLFRQLAQP